MRISSSRPAASVVAAPVRRICAPPGTGAGAGAGVDVATTSQPEVVTTTFCTVPPPKEVPTVLKAALPVVFVGAPST